MSLAQSTPVTRGTALIVDDEFINRLIIENLLKRLGFYCVLACDGQEAVHLCQDQLPDLIFMDVMMPLMDGREAARCIKAMQGGQFIPIIFLTALNEPNELHACIEAGGDDFLSKPIDPDLLSTRILALERTRQLYRQLEQQHQDLLLRIAADREHDLLAERIFSHAVSVRNDHLEGLITFNRPASSFSGDLILSGRLPNGSLRVLLADFTGHGLAAAIGALPVSEVFHAMTARGCTQAVLLQEMNHKLCHLLPDDRFMAAILVDVAPTGRQMTYWAGGMPPILCYQQQSTEQQNIKRLRSQGMALGILYDYAYEAEIKQLNCTESTRLLLMSDGLLDARNAEGATFAQEALQTFIDHWPACQRVDTWLNQSLDQHCQQALPDDDITLVAIDFKPLIAALKVPPKATKTRLPPTWEWSILLSGSNLIDQFDLRALLEPTGFLRWIPAAEFQRLDTLLMELYNNALDHGIFQLASELKSTVEGFEHFYQQRQTFFAQPPSGFIRVQLSFTADSPCLATRPSWMSQEPSNGKLHLSIEDSGSGYNLNKLTQLTQNFDPQRFWGRGLHIANKLADKLTIHPPGNRVTAELSW